MERRRRGEGGKKRPSVATAVGRYSTAERLELPGGGAGE
jgi:hypothetical protein